MGGVKGRGLADGKEVVHSGPQITATDIVMRGLGRGLASHALWMCN